MDSTAGRVCWVSGGSDFVIELTYAQHGITFVELSNFRTVQHFSCSTVQGVPRYKKPRQSNPYYLCVITIKITAEVEHDLFTPMI